ncbi:SDR family NAD(P)-dependent oxidoreductase [Microbacterium album]|uniref:3-oxoacyl-ACP reductase n=1 Tax=Microbacterium album TaxID=2053191 RepID=A0A917ID33_9MICO|nr:SDR family oxidoreductase [Microbacterium album]GGH33655.1 3-oxoacyl-ACP reductase [Microbacterium album]
MDVSVIIGGSAGIGQAAAVEIARRGAAVIVTYRSHPEGAAEVVTQIEQQGGRAAALALDVADVASFPVFRERVSEVLAGWGEERITSLVNNAGVGAATTIEDATEEFWDRLHRILLKAPFFLTKELLPLIADGGAIVNTTSTSTHSTGLSVGYSVYGAMKGGLVVLTRYLAKELAPRGIRVNSVSPGVTRTRLGDDAFTRFPEIIPDLAARVALGRIGEPEDVGKVIAFLTSRDAGWITGQDIEASGGHDL